MKKFGFSGFLALMATFGSYAHAQQTEAECQLVYFNDEGSVILRDKVTVDLMTSFEGVDFGDSYVDAMFLASGTNPFADVVNVAIGMSSRKLLLSTTFANSVIPGGDLAPYADQNFIQNIYSFLFPRFVDGQFMDSVTGVCIPVGSTMSVEEITGSVMQMVK